MTRRTRILIPAAVFLASSCGGGNNLQPRFVAVHNAMTAMGFAQTGAISEGSLPEGGDARIDVQLAGGTCYTFVALGGDGASNIDVRIIDEADEELGRDTTRDRQAAAQVCPEIDGTYRVVVHMAEGNGEYMVSSWSGAVSGGGLGGNRQVAGGGARGSCGQPIDLALGAPVQGATAGAGAVMSGTCAQGTAPEQVYRITIDQRSSVQAVLSSDYDGALYLLSDCNNPATEIVCNDDMPNTTRSEINATLEAGTYFLVVDGYSSEAGNFELIAQISNLASVAQVCGQAQPLPIGQPESGTTSGSANYFQATCANGATSSDHVYALDVPARSRVRISQTSDHDGALYVRRTCEDANTEILCDDDFIDQQHSLVTTVLDAGRYFVYADGFAPGATGNYTLNAELSPEPPTGGPADDCNGPGVVTPGQSVTTESFAARDDVAGSCGGTGAPDTVYRVDLRARSRVTAILTRPQFSGVMYIQSTCGDATSESRCLPFVRGGQGRIDAVLNRGSHFIVIDGDSPTAFGGAQLDVTAQDAAGVERACRAAPLLVSGQTINGDTTTGSDNFQASCAGNAMSNDVLYRLQLRRRQRVRLTLNSAYDGALHMRRDCLDQTTELACNDDFEGQPGVAMVPGQRVAFIETTLDAGTYFVIVDGFHQGSAGTYSLTTQVSNP